MASGSVRHLVDNTCFAPYDDAIVFGPVRGRWRERSLGINVTPPGSRVCSFDCLYCKMGDAPREGRGLHWPSPGEIGSALANALPGTEALDSITISGRGEPTLHPRFCGVVAAVVAEARRNRPDLRVRILTNGSGAVRVEARRALDVLDERIVRIDADCLRINRPKACFLPGAVVASLSLLRDVSLDACFVDGPASNVYDRAVSDWIELVEELQPRRVDIFTVRRSSADWVRPVSPVRLGEIAGRLRARTGIECEVQP